MKKILIVSSMYYPDILGGAEKITQSYAETLCSMGHEVHVLTSGNVDKVEVINGVKVFRYSLDGRYNIIFNKGKKGIIEKLKSLKLKSGDIIYNRYMYKFYYNIFAKENYDIVHTSNNMVYFGMVNCWRAAKDNNIKTIHTLHDVSLISAKIGDKSKLIDDLLILKNRKNIKLVDKFIAPTKYILKLHEKYLGDINNSIIIPNFIENHLNNKNNTYIKKKKIVYVGNIGRHKGVETLINAFNEIGRKEYELILIGEGKDYKELKNKNENKKIIFTGYMKHDDVINTIRESKLLILPSECDEAFGVVLVEAILNNTLAIGSNRGAIPEVLFNQQNLIFESGNCDQLKNSIIQKLNMRNDEYENELNIIKKLCEIYTKKTFIKNIGNLIDSI